MHNTSSSGQHRKPRSTRAIATRTAVYAGTAVLAVGVSASAATAASPNLDAGYTPAGVTSVEDLPSPPPFCSGTFFDAFTSCFASTGSSGNGGDGTGGDTPKLGGGGGG